MKRLCLSAFAAASLAHAAIAGTCLHPEDSTAFAVVSLKSALMVGALSCGHQEQYDIFMTRFQPYILAEQRLVDHYFGRTGGLYAQIQEDAFVTQLANTQSQQSLDLGANFCADNEQVFTQILALATPDDLKTFVQTYPQPSPEGMVECDRRDQVAAK
jgi:hypothetical protein